MFSPKPFESRIEEVETQTDVLEEEMEKTGREACQGFGDIEAFKVILS